MRGTLVWLLVVSLTGPGGCAGRTGTGGEPNGESLAADDDIGEAAGVFSGPEGILIAAGNIWVANANGSWDQATGRVDYDEGYVTVLNLADLTDEAKIITPWLNPQYVFTAEDMIGVVCAGAVQADDEGLMRSVEDGGVVLIDPGTLEIMAQIAVKSASPGPLAGFPGTPTTDPAGETIFLGSGTGPYVYRIDAKTAAMEAFQIHADLSRNDLTVPLIAKGVLHVTSFNTGLLYSLDPATGEQLAAPIDVTETDDIEGPIDMDYSGGWLYVVHTISMRVVAVDPKSRIVKPVCIAGAAANRIVATGNAVIVVNSMDNNLTWCNLDGGGAVSPFSILPLASNPWDVALAGSYAYVTGFKSNALYVVDLTTGDVVNTAY